MSKFHYRRIFLLTAVGAIICMLAFRYVRSRNLADKGVYVVAVLKQTSFNKSGRSVQAEYTYKGKKYIAKFLPEYGFNYFPGRQFFVRILPEWPAVYEYINMDVPDCLTSAGDSGKAWENIPVCP